MPDFRIQMLPIAVLKDKKAVLGARKGEFGSDDLHNCADLDKKQGISPSFVKISAVMTHIAFKDVLGIS